MPKYIVEGSDLTSVANTIRTKGGTSGSLSFPNGWNSAINAISGGGGLEYEEGTWTPSVDTTNPVFNFQNQHSEPPMYVSIYTEGTTSVDMTWLMVTCYRFPLIQTYVHSSVNIYGGHIMSRRTSRGSYGTVYMNLQQEDAFEDYATAEAFTPQGGYDSTYGYWRTGLTYKWIAVWAPTT